MEPTTETTTQTPVALMPQELQASLGDALTVLASLKDELLERQSSMHAQTAELKTRVEEVQELSGDTASSKLIELFEKTAKDYERLVENTIQESDFYTQFYRAYIDSPPQKIQALIAQDSPQLTAHIVGETKLLRSYVKRRRKDFTVIFSRFDHGFANNMSRLKAMKFHIQRRKKHEEAQTNS